VCLPKEFRFSGDRVYIKRVGSAVVLLSYEEPWEPLVASLTLFSEDFMDTRGEPPLPEREAVFP
jgi:antitoxin VapB